MIIALRLIHVFAGVFWAGAVFFVASFLMPSIRDAGPAGGEVARQLIGIRKYPRAVFIIALITVLSGIALYGMNISMSNGAFARSRAGMTYGIGAIAAVLTLVIGMAVLMPTSNKLGALGAAIQSGGGKPSPDQAAEMQRLQGRIASASLVATVLVAITVLTMAIARYV
jgi:uncharacterized membrane protein